jgi:drug/metabolite transporter (DMT)-like permease
VTLNSPAPRDESLGYLAALASAAMVGLFTVLNKWLLVSSVPTLTAAAWTYLAAGLSLAPWAIRHRGLRFKRPGLAACWFLAGSVAGPALYFLGLNLTSGVQGVLMINLEAAFTAFLAFVIFREPLTLVTCVAGLLVLAGGIVVSWPERGASVLAGTTLGNLLIAIGYLGWATENNLGRLLGEELAAVSLVCVKALAAAVAMSLLALIFKQPLVVPRQVVPGIVASGAIALSSSLAFFYFAMRHIGAGRTGLISATSTLWGVVAALVLLGESLTGKVLAGGFVMLVGLCGFAWETSSVEPRS